MLSKLSTRARFIVLGVAIAVVAAVVIVAAFLLRPPEVEEPIATATAEFTTITPTGTSFVTEGATERPDAGGDPGHNGEGESVPMKFTDADLATFSEYAKAAVPAYVAYSTTESTADRATRLAPWFGTSDIVFQKPVLARADLEAQSGHISTVEAKEVNWVSQSSPREGDPIDSVRFGVAMNYVADWRTENVPGAVQTGGEVWELRLPVVQDADGSWAVGSPDDVLLIEPSIDTGA